MPIKPKAITSRLKVNAPVFLSAVVIIFLFVTFTLEYLESAERIFQEIQSSLAKNGGWFFILATNIILVFCFILAFGRLGAIRLGGPDAEPDFSRWAWFAMLYSAGMGIGLVFFAVAEPILHFSKPPIPATIDAQWAQAQEAMGLTFLHWGLHPWAIYAAIGLALAYAGFNKGLPLTIRSIFYPLLGERIYGPIGHVIDVAAAVATLFGVATSLGLGANQINAGLDITFNVPQTLEAQLWLIAGVTLIATISVVSGLDRGIKRLSEMNMMVAGCLMLFIIVTGPTIFILKGFLQNIGYYLQNFPRLATWGETYTGTDWQQNWTVFYYAWWIAWSPFVGMFIARISRGRTIKEFVLAVLIVPTIVGFLWLTVFGTSALHLELIGASNITAIVQESIPQALFAFLENFPLTLVTALLATLVIVTFFVTSADSASLVIGIVCGGGSLEPSFYQRVFWAVMAGIVAAVLLIGGGLTALQTAAITTGLPFGIILLLACYCLYRSLKEDPTLKPV